MTAERTGMAAFACLVGLAACSTSEEALWHDGAGLAVVGATVYDGTGSAPIRDATVVVQEGTIQAIGPSAEIEIPPYVDVVDGSGMYVTPGLINTHGHVGETLGLEGGHYSSDNIVRQLDLYASYGVTTVVSLGGDGPEGVAERANLDFDRARLLVAGRVVTGATPDEAVAMVDQNATMGVDFIKIRVDDNLGSTTKMTPEIYRAVIDRAHELGLPVAAHLFYLEDAEGLLDADVDFLVHSVRDADVDDAFAGRLAEEGVCYSPTLTREISTFVYEDEPEFFSDPFFLAAADMSAVNTLRSEESKARYRESSAAQQYKVALEQALRNLGTLAAAGAPIAMGTDTGPPGRFQGYFEHLEMELMAEAGMTPEQILVAATGGAAQCVGLDDLGTLEVGKWGDFLILREDPGISVENWRTLESVWIAGYRRPSVLSSS